MVKRVIIAVTNNLQTDQRVFKVARTLMENGYEVLAVGRKTNSKQITNPLIPIKIFNLWFNKGMFFYANYNIRLFLFLLFHKFDIVLSNDLDTLPASYLASLIKRKNIVYDSHEYFTEVPELVGRQFQKNVWLWFEKRIVPKLKYTYTVSSSIADVYKRMYGVDFKVVRNVPMRKDFVATRSDKKILIYQGAIQQSRGIELMIEVMQYLDDVELWIVGGGYLEDEIHALTNSLRLTHKVKFLGEQTPFDLSKITPQASLGMSLEEDVGLNYKYALPNKLFDYIQARIPVLVSNLPEMKRIVEQNNIGKVLYDRTPQNVAKQITQMLTDEQQRKEWVENLQKTADTLTWENESQILINIFSDLEKDTL